MNSTKDKIRARIKAKLAEEKAARIKVLSEQAANEIEAIYNEVMDKECKCGTLDPSCPFCNAWTRAERTSFRIIAEALNAL